MPNVHHNSLEHWWEGPNYPEFTRHFDSQQRRALIAEDVFAGSSVSLVLISVVAAGTIAMLLTVLATII